MLPAIQRTTNGFQEDTTRTTTRGDKKKRKKPAYRLWHQRSRPGALLSPHVRGRIDAPRVRRGPRHALVGRVNLRSIYNLTE
jgi:hypothetical protein